MDPKEIIKRYYSNNPKLYHIILIHSEMVTKKALEIATNYLKKPNSESISLKFIEEAAMLHDIGVFLTEAKKIYSYGPYPYISHGYLGSLILIEEGLPKHALVAERHVGTGLTKEDVINEHLMLPKKDMVPVTVEEKIVCLADKFFSKRIGELKREIPMPEIVAEVKKYGETKLKRFYEMVDLLL